MAFVVRVQHHRGPRFYVVQGALPGVSSHSAYLAMFDAQVRCEWDTNVQQENITIGCRCVEGVVDASAMGAEKMRCGEAFMMHGGSIL